MPKTDAKTNIRAKSCESLEDSGNEVWITSGILGSRNAVLVFRTSVLNEKAIQVMDSESCPVERIESTSISDEERGLIKNVEISGGSKLEKQAIPSTSRNVQMMFEKKKKSLIKSPKIVRTIAMSEKTMSDSLSSSDFSISSECDDLEDIKEKVSLQANTSNDIASSEEEEEEAIAVDEEEKEDFDYYAPVIGMPAADLKLTYKFVQTETKLLRKIFTRHGLTEADEDENFSILWAGVHIKPDILRNLAPYQRVNHFPRSYELTRKDRLYKNIEKMQHLRGLKHFDIIPQSFMLPLEYRDLITAHNKYRGPWIVKPAASSRGRGIFIVNSPDQIPQDEQLLVSKYIADPLCIDGHKCDLRVYVLVTSFDPLIIYLYEEGLVRLATVKYDLQVDNLWNPCMHLCNYSINKYHTDYIKSNDAHDENVGHKWTLSALLRHLKFKGYDTYMLMESIEDLIIKSIFSCAQSVISACRMFVPNVNNCFELYGFDILIDDNLKPWLLEVNLSPSMGVDSPLDAKVKSCLITDLLTCVGIPAFSPTMRAHYDSKCKRYRNISSLRRTSSAENAGYNEFATKRNGLSTAGNCVRNGLTLEQEKIVLNSRLQNDRRGRFVRIFPTDDSMIRYGNFLDATTGIPISTPILHGQSYHSTFLLQHNYNQMLFFQLYGNLSNKEESNEGNLLEQRMFQYERTLEAIVPTFFESKHIEPKCKEEGKRLRKQILKMIGSGSALTQLQARQTFRLYLEAVLKRLSQDPKSCHEKLILKFLNRVGGPVKAPILFRSPQNTKVASKARSAMIAKLLGDFLEQYNRETEAYVDTFNNIGMIPPELYLDFLAQAEEADLEDVLTLNTNLTGSMTYLYNRCGVSVPSTPKIPSGYHGFLKALPSMVVGGSGSRDFNKCDSYYKLNFEKEKKDIGKK